MKSLKNYTVLGICAGNGAVLYPFKSHLLGNIEPRGVFRSPQHEQWIKNFDKIPALFDYPKGLNLVTFDKKATIVMGHPDCGHSSVLAYSRGKKLSDPKDNKSLTLFIRAIQVYKPKVFLMENLPALLKTYGESDLMEAFEGYELKFIQGSVSKWGNSQV